MNLVLSFIELKTIIRHGWNSYKNKNNIKE